MASTRQSGLRNPVIVFTQCVAWTVSAFAAQDVANESAARVSPPESKSITSLHEAAERGDLVQLCEWLEKGAPVDSPDSRGQTPLHRAAAAGKPDAVRLLIERGANVNAKNSEGITPIEAADRAAAAHFQRDHAHPLEFNQIFEDLAFAGAVVGGIKLTDMMMHKYAFAYSVEEAELLLKKGANVNACNEYGTPLHMSAGAGAIEKIELFVAYGANVEAKDHFGQTPLHSAAQAGQKEAVRRLLKSGAKAQAVDDFGRTPLHVLAEGTRLERDVLHRPESAAGLDYSGTAKLLIEAGAPVNAKNRDGDTALHLAARDGHMDVAEVLLGGGAEINSKNTVGASPLHYAMSSLTRREKDAELKGAGALYPSDERELERFRQLVKWFQDHNALDLPPSVANSDDCSSPQAISEDEQFDSELREENGDVNGREEGSEAGLHGAASSGDASLVQRLLKSGAEVDARDRLGRTALVSAAEAGQFKTVIALIDAGASVNVGDWRYPTLLHAAVNGASLWSADDRRLASSRNYADTIRALVSGGVSVDSKGPGGRTVLHLAAEHGNYEIVQTLLNVGARFDALDDYRKTPLHLAAFGDLTLRPHAQDEGHSVVDFAKVASLLIEKGADVNAATEDNSTPIHLAAITCNIGVVELLLAHGANKNVRANYGETPLMSARRGMQGKSEMREMLTADEYAQSLACFEKLISLLEKAGAKE